MAYTTNQISGFTFAGIRITVTYTDGSGYSMSPSSGNVNPGQQITITGPKASELEIVAITDEDQVIPIIPKIISENEIVFEIPYPPDEECFSCYDECPECNTCATACAEDILGEECQACMQSCLDCLTRCFLNLEVSEACWMRTAEDEPPVITIAIAETTFSGSVILGSFTILEAEASGIYRFVEGKTNDTLYTPARDGTTYDVKIPNPGGKTGFFRS